MLFYFKFTTMKSLEQILKEALLGKEIYVVQFPSPKDESLITHLDDRYILPDYNATKGYKKIIDFEIMEYEYEPCSVYITIEGSHSILINLTDALNLKLK